MLTEAYIEALLVDEELADMVWERWDAGLMDDELAFLAWMLIVVERSEVAELDCVYHARSCLKLLLLWS